MTGDLFGALDPIPDPASNPDRIAWRMLVEQTLPGLAPSRDWPIRLDHCFARVLLDNAVGEPWREAIPAPAWRNTPLNTLRAAIALGQGVIEGTEDLHALNAHSLALRCKSRPTAPTVLK